VGPPKISDPHVKLAAAVLRLVKLEDLRAHPELNNRELMTGMDVRMARVVARG